MRRGRAVRRHAGRAGSAPAPPTGRVLGVRTPPPSVEVDHPVGHGQQARAGGQPRSRCARPSAGAPRRGHLPRSRPSRLAVGSSRSSSGASRRNARARATRWRSPGGQPWPPVAEHGVQPVGKARHDASSPASATAARNLVVGGVGRPRRMLSAMDRAKRCGRWGTQADLRPPRVRVEVGQVNRRRHGPIPCDRATNPSSTPSRVDLPQPLGPARATTSPGIDRKGHAARAGTASARVA